MSSEIAPETTMMMTMLLENTIHQAYTHSHKVTSLQNSEAVMNACYLTNAASRDTCRVAKLAKIANDKRIQVATTCAGSSACT